MHGRGLNFAAAVYYISGGAYYFYHWFVIGGSVGVAVGLGAILFSPLFAAALIPLSLIVLVVGVVVWARSRMQTLQATNPGLKELSTEFVYTISDNAHYEQLSRRWVKALHPGIDSFKHGFTWSGTGQIRVFSGTGQELQIAPDPHGPDTYFKVPFSRPLAKGEKYKLEYRITMTDTQGTARPFLIHRVTTATRTLVLRVVVPYAVSSYQRLVFSNFSTAIPVREEVVSVPAGGREFSFEEVRPRIGYRYCIHWQPPSSVERQPD